MPPILATFGQICNFRDPKLVTIYFYELTQDKHSSTFANRKYEKLSYPKNSENVRPH